jgi:hypothetical protein
VSPSQAVRRLAVAAVTVAALAACSSGGSGFSATEASPTSSKAAVPPPPETAPPSVAVSTAAAVKVGKPAPIASDVVVTVGAIRSIKVEAKGPGATSGPALVVPLTVKNTSAQAFELGGLVVNAYYGKGTPAVPADGGPAKPLAGSVRPGGTQQGEYVFRAPASALSTLMIEVSSSNAAKVLVFQR